MEISIYIGFIIGTAIGFTGYTLIKKPEKPLANLLMMVAMDYLYDKYITKD